VSGTCNLLRTINALFDRMNSRNPFGKYLQSPLGMLSKDEIFNDFAAGEAYILSLTMQPLLLSDSTDEPKSKKMRSDILIVSGPRRKGFLGFLVNMITFKKVFEIYIQTGHLKYLLTFKTSQDHVELLFCSIRGSLGKNNNPTTREFTTSLKKILLGTTHHSQFANCLLQDDSEIIPFSSSLEETFKINEEVLESEEICQVREYIDALPSLSEYKSDVLVYIAGYVQRQILSKEQCIHCKNFLLNVKIVQTSHLLDIKNRGAPAYSVC